MSNIRAFGWNESGTLIRLRHRLSADVSSATPVTEADKSAMRTSLGVADFTGAAAGVDGAAGRVPKPLAGQQGYILFADGTFKPIPAGTGNGDVLAANNLSEFGTGQAKRVSARANLDVFGTDEALSRLTNRSPRGGLFFDGVNPGNIISGGTNSLLALGTADFSIAWTMTMKDWTPVSNGVFFSSHSAGNNRFFVTVTTTGTLQLTFVDAAGVSTTYTLTPDVALVDGESYHFILSVDRDGLATLYINGSSDRDKNATAVTVSVAASSTVDIGIGNTNGYQVGLTLSGFTLHGVLVYNRLIGSSGAALLSRAGAAELSDQWGSLTPSYTSNFTAGADSFITATDVTLTGNVDGVSDGTTSKDDCLRIATGTGTSIHLARRSAILTRFKRYRVTLSYYIPTGQAFNRLRIGHATNSDPSFGNTFDLTTVGAWTTGTGEFTGNSAGADLYVGLMNNAATIFNGVAGESAYIKDIVITPLGAVLDLDVENAEPLKSSAVRDRSSNANHATAAPAEISQVRKLHQINPDRISVGGGRVMQKLLSETASLNFGSIAAQASADLTITVNGAAVGDSVCLGLPAGPETGIVYNAFVSALNTVTVRATNVTAAPIDPAAASFRATVLQF